MPATWVLGVPSFHVLQFMDFWLSFIAVVSTFVYMATIDESSKRAIHTVVAIITALLAVSGATRSENIVLVIAIGTSGLLIGWLLEFSTSCRSRYCPIVFDLNMSDGRPEVLESHLHQFPLWNKSLCGLQVLSRKQNKINEMWQNMKRWFLELISTPNERFSWPFVILGFTALAFAATSWTLESNNSY